MSWVKKAAAIGLWMAIVNASVMGQCPAPESLDFLAPPCGLGLMKGQSFMLPESGQLDSITLSLCSGTTGELVIRSYNGDGSDWDEGALIGQASALAPASGELADCLTSSNGFTHYTPHTFSFSNVPLEGGVTYIMHLVQGAAATACTISYPGGVAFGNSANASHDLAFHLFHCPDPSLVFGCTDAAACNFNPSATADDASCLTEDCAGNCGGNSVEDECGVCDGDNSTCAGCTDSNACNYDSTAISDDGSCLQEDCNGDCGGSAYEASCGTCIEGNTGLDITACDVCPDQERVSFYEAPCGLGLLTGQSFSVQETGSLHSITLAVCTGMNNRLVIRSFNGTDEWDQGVILGEANAILSATGSPSNCFVSSNGFNSYTQHTFEFSDVGLIGGTTYIMHLLEGAAASGCTTSYPNGQAFSNLSGYPGHDLVFEVNQCPDETLVFGCTDSSACNFNPSATAEDGTCLELDCFDICGGTAYLDPDCGCVPSEADAGSCFGCTDAQACNFDGSATVEDNSCLYEDCHGDCGGTAIESACGECVGGNTAFHGNACIDECLTEVLSTDSVACGPGLLYGQSFTAETTGRLEQIQLKVCCALDAQLALRRHTSSDPCTGAGAAEWNAGEILGTSQLIPSTCEGLGNCLTTSGLDGYDWVTFTFDDVFIQEGTQYTMELIEGVALATCSPNYVGGHAFRQDNPAEQVDLAMAIFTCAEANTFGCMDDAACNYDLNAEINDGSCLYLDCHGDCGGSATLDPECGCLGGQTGIRAEQCVNGELQLLIANDITTCSSNLFGQTFSMPEDGFLTSTSFHLDLTAGQSIELRREDGPLAGQLEGAAMRTGTTVACASSANAWHAFSFPETPLQGGSHYRIVFTDGTANPSCTPTYSGGHGLTWNGAEAYDDLAFRIIYRTPNPGELAWGCTDPSACNYDASATEDDGSCAEVDCHGDCAGDAQFVENCGCIGGNTGIALASCFGCTDEAACNFSSEASIDDGSCEFFIDCTGECGGSAIWTPGCGCTGGSSGNNVDNCFALCEGELDHSTYPDDDLFSAGAAAFSSSGQTFHVTDSGFLVGTKIRVFGEPSSPLSIELRATDASNVHDGTLLASSQHTSWEDTPGLGGDVFIEWDIPALLQAGESYAFIILGTEWAAIRSQNDLIQDGASFNGSDLTAFRPDLYFELWFCTDLYGCSDPIACNYVDWVTANDGSCSYAAAGEDCDGNPCDSDSDGDGICDIVDSESDNPFLCMDGDQDGCDDCMSGTYDPFNDGDDADGDGLCDEGDLCSNMDADNFDDPNNDPCRGACDTAPLFESIQVGLPASSTSAEDGTVLVSALAGSMLYVPSSSFQATSLQLTGLNGAQDYVLELPVDTNHGIAPGWYSAVILNDEGCLGVASLSNGSAFGQAPISFPLVMTYSLCCGDCGNSDVDNDMICDSEDECIDRQALNYADPANTPCQY